jgi:hypothetical protein
MGVAMPRFFFHVCDGIVKPDTVGTELRSVGQARMKANRLAAAVLIETPHAIWHGEDRTIEVTNENGLIVFVVQLKAIEAPDLRTVSDESE